VNPRERILALVVVLAVILGGAGFLVFRFYIAPRREREESISALNTELKDKEEKIRQVLAERPKLERWRQLSLPANIDLAAVEYENYLQELFQHSGFAKGAVTIVPKQPDPKASSALPGKATVYTRLPYMVTAHGNLANLVQMLDDFYSTSLLQQIRQLNIQRPQTLGPQQRPDELDITMTIEALNVAGSGNRSYLLPNVPVSLAISDALLAMRGAPSGLLLAAWAASPAGPLGPGLLAEPPRQYSAISSKNIFFGQGDASEVKGEKNVTRYVHLTNISRDSRRCEAWLYDRLNNKWTRLRAEAGFDSFRVLDDAGETAARGRVVRMEPRDLVFRANDGKYYSLHVGENLEDAMKHSVTTERLRSLGLVEAGDGKRSPQQ
jgi:hypothetical protein